MSQTTGNLSHVTRSASDLLAKTGRGRVRAVMIQGATSAEWILRDGTDVTGAIIGHFKCSSTRCVAFDWPIQFETGLFLDNVAGSSRITVTFE